MPSSAYLPALPSPPQAEWYRVDIPAIQDQMPYRLLPVYLEQSPSPDSLIALPYRAERDFELDDGPHLGYAIQWFLFAMILPAGYLRHAASSSTPRPAP